MELKKEKQALDHQVWKLVKLHDLTEKKILVALSGGVDSVALLRVLSKVHPLNQLGVCYFHHGEDSNQEYRREAQVFCEKLCSLLKVPFFPLHASEFAKSEADYRELRYEALRRVMFEGGFDVLSTGHHRDDLLETRLLRLIRGTGGQGLQAMQIYSEGLFRPLLEISKKDLKHYLHEEGIHAFSDPSNSSLDPLRNWIREHWLPELGRRSPGATASLARSLETIAEELQDRPWDDLLSRNESFSSQGLSRAFYLTLSLSEQRRLLAQYLYALDKRDYSQAHLLEIQKRLDISQKVITFKVGGCDWEINAEQIKVQS